MKWAPSARILTSDPPLDAAGSELSIARRISGVRRLRASDLLFLKLEAKCFHQLVEYGGYFVTDCEKTIESDNFREDFGISRANR